MNEERIIELEIKLAYQEDLLQTLNKIVAKQQEQIQRLQDSHKLLYQRQQTLAEKLDSNQTGHEIPPHY